MPRKRSYRRRRPRRRRRFRRRRRGTRIVVRKMPTLMPDSIKVKLRWSDTRSITSLTSQYSLNFRLNDPFNPDGTGSSQPLGWDQWSAFYNHYICLASKIFIEPAMIAGDQGKFVIVPMHDTSSITDYSQAFEERYRKIGYTAGPATNPKSMRAGHFMTMRKLEGAPLYSVNYAATTTASPSLLRYWGIFGRVADGLVDDITMDITLTYYIKLYRPKNLGLS